MWLSSRLMRPLEYWAARDSPWAVWGAWLHTPKRRIRSQAEYSPRTHRTARAREKLPSLTRQASLIPKLRRNLARNMLKIDRILEIARSWLIWRMRRKSSFKGGSWRPTNRGSSRTVANALSIYIRVITKSCTFPVGVMGTPTDRWRWTTISQKSRRPSILSR